MTNILRSPFFLAALVLGLFFSPLLILAPMFGHYKDPFLVGAVWIVPVWIVLLLLIVCLLFISKRREEPVRRGVYRFLVYWVLTWNLLSTCLYLPQ